jgi:predicted HTH domain antitoxin
MATVRLELGEDLAAVLERFGKPVELLARELIVVELYRREAVSRGRAAELLGMPLRDFLDLTSRLGIPYVTYTKEEWAEEMRSVDDWVDSRRSSAIPAR